MSATPIALFTYNRPEHTQRILSSLMQCSRFDECTVHIFCDGAKTPAHQAAVNASRIVVRDFASHRDAHVIERNENLGLARSIVEGVTSLVHTYGRVIVLEDDLILSPDFLNYMLQSLDRFQDEPRVYQIAGYSFPIPNTPQSDTFFLPLTTTWGWATWDRAWKAFDWNPPKLVEHLRNPDFRAKFDLDNSYPYTKMLEQRLVGQNDSWGILWWYAVFSRDGLVLYPKLSLIRNDGFDGTGTHSGRSRTLSKSLYTDISKAQIASLLQFPLSIEADATVWTGVKNFLLNQQKQLRWASVFRRLRHKLTG
jgi:hypothetical protein